MDIRQMYSRTDGGDYRLGVRDFGSIERADVEFRPLTVFVGPSNTGKSYLATLSYALHRYFAAEADHYALAFSTIRSCPGSPCLGPRGLDETLCVEGARRACVVDVNRHCGR